MNTASITIYVSDDGREFRSREACEQYERDAATVSAILAPLGRRIDTIDYANGSGYVQHDGITGDMVWNLVRKAPGAQHSRDADEPWSKAYYRAMCIDAQGREWGQPYFANNPPADAKEITR